MHIRCKMIAKLLAPATIAFAISRRRATERPHVFNGERRIYLAFAEHIKAFALGGSWATLAAFLPMGIAFGAIHAMT